MTSESPVGRITHVVSLGSSVMALGVDIMRLSQQATYLARGPSRPTAVACRFFYVQSDLPRNQVLGRVWPIVWIGAQLALTLLVVLADVPGRWVTKKLNWWWNGTGEDVGLWHTGALQMLLGSTILATPGLGIYGSAQSVFWRFITGWMSLGIGTINLILGMAVKGTIRKWRHQTKTDKEIEAEGGTKNSTSRSRSSDKREPMQRQQLTLTARRVEELIAAVQKAVDKL